MNLTQHSTNNGVAAAPVGVPIDIIRPAPYTLFNDGVLGPCIQTFWRPEPEELAALNRGCLVMLTVASLNVYPHRVEVAEGL